ncbi:hypothetical protein BDAP_001659 [Binucleata daphniae]
MLRSFAFSICLFSCLVLCYVRNNRNRTELVDRSQVYIYSPIAKGFFKYNSTAKLTTIIVDANARYPQAFFLNEKNERGGLSISVYKVINNIESTMPVLDLRWDNDLLILHDFHGGDNQILYLTAISSRFLKIICVDLCVIYDQNRMLWRKIQCKKSFEDPRMLFRVLGNIPENYYATNRNGNSNTNKYNQGYNRNDRRYGNNNNNNIPNYAGQQCRNAESRRYDTYDNFIRNRLKDVERDTDGLFNFESNNLRRSSLSSQIRRQNIRKRERKREGVNYAGKHQTCVIHPNSQNGNDYRDKIQNTRNDMSNTIAQKTPDVNIKNKKKVSLTKNIEATNANECENKCSDVICSDYDDFINNYTKELDNITKEKTKQVGQKIKAKSDDDLCDNLCEDSRDEIRTKQKPIKNGQNCMINDASTPPVGDLSQYYKQVYNTVKRLEKSTPQVLLNYDKPIKK